VTAPELSLVVTNARIRTGNPARPWATALGILDGKLAVVGMAAEILKMVRAKTGIIDAGGQLLTLPNGLVLGCQVTVTVASDGNVSLHFSQERS
jgi:hypothetical protein